jgi:hypothetical protein
MCPIPNEGYNCTKYETHIQPGIFPTEESSWSYCSPDDGGGVED